MIFFDSLTHATYDGSWLHKNHFDAKLSTLLDQAKKIGDYRSCLVNIADLQDNDELEKIAAEYPEYFVPIAGFNPSSYQSTTDIERNLGELSERNFAGIKLHSRLNNYDPLDERCLYTISRAHKHGMAVFLDTLFRQQTIHTRHTPDIIDRIAVSCPDTKILLLHGGGTSMLDIYEIVRMRRNLLLDTSFSIMRYRGSSLDLDISFVMETLDQRITVGSDFPEYSLEECREHINGILSPLSSEKQANIWHKNLEHFLENWLTKND